jgi:hypothetical protein
MPRIHIRRRENGTLHAVAGTEEPRAGDITLTFDHTFNEDRVADFRNHIERVDARGLGLSPIYPENERFLNMQIGNFLMLSGSLALFLFAVTAIFLYFGHEEYPGWSLLAAAAWTIVVPIYFFIEHEYIFLNHGNALQYDQFKRVQDLAAKIWAGAIAVLGAIVAFKLSK